MTIPVELPQLGLRHATRLTQTESQPKGFGATASLERVSNRAQVDRGAPPVPPRDYPGAKAYVSTLLAGELGQVRTIGMRATSTTTVAGSVSGANAVPGDRTPIEHGALVGDSVTSGSDTCNRVPDSYGSVSRVLLHDRPGPYTSTGHIELERALSPGTRSVSFASDAGIVSGTGGRLSSGATHTEYTVGPSGANDQSAATAEPIYEHALPVDYARLHGISWWRGSASIGNADHRVPPYVPADRTSLHDGLAPSRGRGLLVELPQLGRGRGAQDRTDVARHDEVRTSGKHSSVIERGFSALRHMFAGIWNALRHRTSHKGTPVEVKLRVYSRTGVPPTIDRASHAVLSSGPKLESLLGSPDTPSNRSQLQGGFMRFTYGMQTFEALATAGARAGDVPEHIAQEIENLAAYSTFANGDTLVQLVDRMHRLGDYGFLTNPLMQQEFHDYLGMVTGVFEKYAIATENNQLLGNVLDASLNGVDASPGRYVGSLV